MFSKVLVANRGEIAIRAFRAAYEIGARTVAVFPHEDRWSEHRLKADEAYEIGERGHPVRAYLDPEAIVAAAVRAGADAVYPGYGFLSENPALAEACANAGITFIGPTADVLDADRQQGPRDRRGQGGRRARRCSPSSRPPTSTRWSRPPRPSRPRSSSRPSPAAAAAACAGSTTAPDLREAIETCMREAEGAFGDPTVFIEQAVVDPRHIEVQILADGEGNVDPPLRARLLGAAPPPEGRRDRPGAQPRPAELRDRMCADAVRFAREIGYRNAGTVEFLLDPAGNYVFIEMNPRIQVEHTVTEEITDVDLVQSQMRIAVGRDARRPRPLPGGRSSSAAPPCSAGSPPRTPPTASAPTPARSRPTAPPAAPGVRIDGGTTYTGAEVSAHFDSMLAKLTCRGRDFDKAVERARRAVAEFRIRGVSTNIAFLQAVLDDPDFAAGRVTTSFIEDHPQLLSARASGDRGTKLLTYLADVTVNQPHGAGPGDGRPGHQAARRRPRRARPRRQPAAPAAASGPRSSPARCAPRTGSRSPTPPSATPTSPCSPPGCAPATCSPWPATSPGPPPSCGRSRPGAGRRTTWRCASCPRTRGSGSPRLRQAVPNICLQMLLRGRNTVGYTPYPTEVTEAFVAGGGRDRHRRLPHLRRAQRRRADAPGDRGRARHRHARSPRSRSATPATCPTPTRRSTRSTTTSTWPSGSSTPAPTCSRSRTWPACCACPAARTLVTALRERVRPARAPAHPRHPRRPARDAARRDRRGRRRGRRRLRLDGRHDVAAAAVRAGLGHRPRPARDRPVAGQRQRAGALLGGHPPRLRALRVRACRRRPAGSTATRSPAASSPTCASRRSRSASARSSSRSRTCTPPPTTSSATWSR